MDELSRGARGQLAGRIARNGVQVDIGADLPVLYGDRSRLAEVLQNLVENALKYTGDQTELHIEIGARRDGEENVYYVYETAGAITSFNAATIVAASHGFWRKNRAPCSIASR